MPYQSGAMGVFCAWAATAAFSSAPSASASTGMLARSSDSGSSGRVLNWAVMPPRRTKVYLSRSLAPMNAAFSDGGAVDAVWKTVPPR